MDDKKKFYATRDITEKTGLKDFTLRKYVRELETAGHEIKRDYADNRLYSTYDVEMISEMVKLLGSTNARVTDVAGEVMRRKDELIMRVDERESAETEQAEQETDKIDKLIELVTAQTEQIAELKHMNIELMNALNKALTIDNKPDHKAISVDDNTDGDDAITVVTEDSNGITDISETVDIAAVDDVTEPSNSSDMETDKTEVADEGRADHNENRIGKMLRENEEVTNNKGGLFNLFGLKRRFKGKR